ncbi:VWA domain-containing protein [Cryptosporangium arvum]|uniref:Protein containing von Willebrand factor type A (VWA) domain n=1 Tax=Cryptosporangium arvum DSM 44712 TaxID=927661 RepID=A0A011A0H8_9ACTN|nr:VWA domain-containing protein [Cryptosporangium arvum]EXG82997.1 protein containing von Willebrand factor type A (vWA) domain [Cryptosporangium arvum DSM 44712]
MIGPMTDHLHGFVRDLVDHGVGVTPERTIRFLRAADPADLYWTARITLTASPAEHEIFEPIFWRWFADLPVAPAPAPAGTTDTPAPGGSGGGTDPVEQHPGSDRGLAASPTAAAGTLRFGRTTRPDLLARIRRDLPGALPPVRSRRRRPAHRGDTLDVRRVAREAARTHGEVLRLRRRRRPARPRRMVLLVDVSGSMKQHAADLLRVGHAAVRSGARAEVFTFGTELTHVTSSLRAVADPDAALAALGARVLDADGGTRIGSALGAFLEEHRSAVAGAVVVVFSDGLERGDPTAMVTAVRRLRRLGHRLVWWSPLACDPAYRPVTRAMAAIADDLCVLDGVGDLASAHRALKGLRP